MASVGNRFSKADKSIALPTIAVDIQCKADESKRSINALLDTGSQVTLIKREVVERLDLPILEEQVYTSLQGYAGQKIRGQMFKTIKFKIQKKGYKKIFEVRAYIVESLVTLNMPGLSSICHRIDNHGIDLAKKGSLDTRRDTIEIDFLVGND